jgi:hypothetical protein
MFLVYTATPWPQFESELYRPNDRRLSAKLVPTFAGGRMPRGQRDWSLRRILDFLDRDRYFFFQVASQLFQGKHKVNKNQSVSVKQM